jgi:predicted CoA-substrate-specific enzyme activase
MSDERSNGSDPLLYLGLDVGSVNARLALVDADGRLEFLARERIFDGPAAAVQRLLAAVAARVGKRRLGGATACGTGRACVRGLQGWQIVSSPYAMIHGVLHDVPDARTIIEIGGQSSCVVALEGGLDRPWRVARSPLCAAGTGRFLEQQASRLGIGISAFGPTALQWNDAPPRIAARCSVFAKSDLIHLQQKGWPVEAMLAGLCDSVARMVRAQWRDAMHPPILLVGGVSANVGVVRALEVTLGQDVIVPPSAADRAALGAALLSRSLAAEAVDLALPASRRTTGVRFIPSLLHPEIRRDGWRPPSLPEGETVDAYLGVDVGSTSTKAAVVTPDGQVLAKSYHMTAGQPLEAVKRVMADLCAIERRVRVRAVGVTGSGRYLVGHFVGADVIRNEITAQARAARQIDPSIDTIFELGGQDSKYVYMRNGIILEYQMNKACAAGTGSFIDELAEQLGTPTRTGEFARLAFEAGAQLDLGERCAAFMSQAVTSAQHAGAPAGVVAASLATSLAKNYHSKVVGRGRVGQRILLTGAVFYNEAVAAAFKAEFPDKRFVVAEHKEVSGAIGAALLAGEQHGNAPSAFRGFSAVASAAYALRSFTCQHCENNCAISVMTDDAGRRFYYGSRCDRYDAASEDGVASRPETAFAERERLLYAGVAGADAADTTGQIRIGVPRALMIHDLAPLFTTYLKALGVRPVYSAPTHRATIEHSLEHSYADSCFPVKLLHGHVHELLTEGVDYILVPNAIRLGAMGGEEDQRYACPWVQAAPYIVRSVFGLGERLLDPIIDLSQGDERTIESLAEVATRMGLTRDAGRAAAVQGLEAQRRFEASLQERGQALLDEVCSDASGIGVVIMARSYNAQDAGANLGIAAELSRLGVTPIPLDYLPLDRVDIAEITDRPYWSYERKLLAAARLIAEERCLFGLFLTNFGCGPNAFIENMVRDIMGDKPLGEIEVDEHAAEAGIITRLEALVDTIRAYRSVNGAVRVDPERYARRVPSGVRRSDCLLLPRMADHADVMAGVARSFGVDARVLPDSDARSLALSRDVTSGKECLPYRDSLGVLLRAVDDGDVPPGARALMAGSYGPCRLGKYAQEQQKVLRNLGIDLQIMTTVSNNAYADLGLGRAFELYAWQAVLAVDSLQRLLWMTRPYERSVGGSDRAYRHYLAELTEAADMRRPLLPILVRAMDTFLALRDRALPQRPLVGINGEIYLRANAFANQDVVRLCEAHGLEVEVAPLGEWFKYTSFRNWEDMWNARDLKGSIKALLRRAAMARAEARTAAAVRVALPHGEPSTETLLRASGQYLPSRNGSEAVLSLGSGLLQMRDPRYAGVISVMPHGCMPGGIVAALSEQISREYGHKPWISLTFDGFADQVNPERVADMAEQLRHQARRGVRGGDRGVR